MQRACSEKSKGHGKERLLQAARSLAQHSPFDEVTIEEIVKAASLSRPAFYYHFPGGKDELRNELIRTGYLDDEPTPNIRENILDVALRVFGRSGVYAATLEDIANEAGISRGTLCWYYRTKDDLLTAIMQRNESYQALCQAIDSLDRDLQNGCEIRDEDFLCRIAGGFYDSLSEQGELARLPILLLYTHPEVAHILADKIIRGRQPIMDYVKKRQEEGAFNRNIDAAFFVQVIAMTFYMRVVGRELYNLLPFNSLSREEAIQQLVSLLLHGIVQPDAEKTSIPSLKVENNFQASLRI